MNLAWDWDQLNAVPSAGNCNPTWFTVDTKGTSTFCEVRDGSGFTTRHNVVIRIDRVAPNVGALPGRPPDHAGWFNHPVKVTFGGSDATSGVAGCTSATHEGTEGEGVLVSGSCMDFAGNVGTGAFALNYDATRPREPGLRATPGNRRVRLRWSLPPDATAVEVLRLGPQAELLHQGAGGTLVDRRLRNGVRHRYRVVAIDQAGNRTPTQTSATPTTYPLLSPAAGAHLREPPLLQWKRVEGATHYNVQLFRDSRKILSRWPRLTRFQLTRSWRFAGKRRRLVPGVYTWYIWPAFGRRADQRYGDVLGVRRFTMTR